MNILWIDLETFSPENLPKVGSYKYAENPETEIMLFGYAWNDEEVEVWDLTISLQVPAPLIFNLEDCDLIVSHHTGFDRVVLEKSKLAPLFKNKQWADSMIKAYSHSLPGGLSTLSDTVFRLKKGEGKIKEGRQLIHLFCKPQGKNRKLDRCTRHTHPEEWKQFKQYLRQDIISMRIISKKIPSWNMIPFEKKLWMIDQKINDRGIYIDKELAEKAIIAIEKEGKKNKKRTKKLTEDEVQSATQRDALLKYILKIYNIELPNMQKATLERRLKDPDLPEDVKELIRLRLEISGTSTSKYQSALNIICKDGRVHGTLQFDGAWRTGRWAGRLLQTHNFPRPLYKNNVVETGIEAIKLGIADLLFPSVNKITMSTLRGMICAPPGKKLIVADYKSIEGVGVAWIAGEKWKVEYYHKYHNKEIEYDMYVATYSKIFSIKMEDVTSGQRQLGKVMELALGYGGGVGAFVSAAAIYKINLQELVNSFYDKLDSRHLVEAEVWYHNAPTHYDLSEDVFITCDAIKRMWREQNYSINRFWWNLEQAVRDVVKFNKKVNLPQHKLVVDKVGKWLRIKLPSGRYLSYPGIRINEVDNKISYLGMDIYTKKWCRVFTHGGKLVENVTQAVCRDLLACGIINAEEHGYPIILTVHDELLAEVPDVLDYSIDEFIKLITKLPAWAENFPIAANGYEAYRYRKD